MRAHENVAAPGSYLYPDVSLSKKICAQGQAVVSLPMVLCASSPVTRVPLAFRACLCAKNEAPEDQAVATL